MRVLLSSYFLDLSGVPTYTLTLYHELRRRGHDVTVYSPQGGPLGNQMRTCSILDGTTPPDVILAQANVCAESMRAVFPRAPMIFSAHGVLPAMEQPPRCEVQGYTAINEDVAENLAAHGVDAGRIEIVRDFVDTDRFLPMLPLNERVRRVLFISNFKKWRTYDLIAGACKKIGAELKAVGAPYGRSPQVEHEINRADLVVSVARGILEGMACGRPAISFNQLRGDGYLTPEVYLESRTRNFAGARCRHAFDVDGLAGEMSKYDTSDGMVNRRLVMEHHDHVKGVDRLLEIVGRLCGHA